MPNTLQRGEINDRPAWLVTTRRTAMLLCLGPDDALLLPHWGLRGDSASPAEYLFGKQGNRPSNRAFLDGLPLAYAVYGDPLFKEVCLVAARSDGARESRLCFAEERTSESQGHPTLDLVFNDEFTGLSLTHHFRAFSDHDVIARWVSIANRGSGELVLERALTASLPLPPDEYDAWTLHGQWGREHELRRHPLGPGKFVLESRRGLSSHEAHPWFAVRPRGESAEHAGPVWFGSLAWSGNWICTLEVERNDALHIVTGIQPFDFAWRLKPGEIFETPELVCGYTEEGSGGASRVLHAFEEEVWLPPSLRDRPRPVLYNSWEATQFDVSADQQMELARKASSLGIELFVVDDGWFGQRRDDHAGLGDWYVNSEKFPHGLRELIDEVHRLGMQFGIWIEPEMVNQNSDLYRAHPDWVYHAEGRSPTFARNQLVLNFARDDVREAILDQLRRLLSEHGTIEFIKMDHNRSWTEVGWPEQPDHQREVWVRHVLGLYDMLAQLRRAFPNTLIESCAGGGGRADLGILRLTDQVWTSDNTDAADRLTIQYGYSHAHTPRVMVNWVTDVPNDQTGRSAPLAFRFHVAMQGVLGIGGNIIDWSDAELDDARRLIAQYKDIRDLVQFGRQYWLRPPSPLGPSAVQYVSRSGDRTAVLLYQIRGLRGAGVRHVRLRGLQPEQRYRRDGDGAESTGAALMAAGVPASLVDPTQPRPVLDWQSRLEVWRSASPA
jgi:alpha-galactosidase